MRIQALLCFLALSWQFRVAEMASLFDKGSLDENGLDEEAPSVTATGVRIIRRVLHHSIGSRRIF